MDVIFHILTLKLEKKCYEENPKGNTLIVPYLSEKKFTCKWTHTVQTCGVQGSTVQEQTIPVSPVSRHITHLHPGGQVWSEFLSQIPCDRKCLPLVPCASEQTFELPEKHHQVILR